MKNLNLYILLLLVLVVGCEKDAAYDTRPCGLLSEDDCGIAKNGDFSSIKGQWDIASFVVSNPNYLSKTSANKIKNNVKLHVTKNSLQFIPDPRFFLEKSKTLVVGTTIDDRINIKCRPAQVTFTKTTLGAYFYNMYKDTGDSRGFGFTEDENTKIDLIITNCEESFFWHILKINENNLAISIQESFFKLKRKKSK